MPKVLLCALICFIFLGCNNYLVYRGDFDDNKVNYYTTRLATEDKIQKQSIAEIEQNINNLLQLCYVLYHRMPIQRDKDYVQKINLKLVRLNHAIKILEDMRDKFHRAFHLIFSREDMIVGPLQLQFAIEVQYMASYLDLIHEIRARIIYLDEFRKKCMLEVGLPEEKLEAVDSELLKVEKLLANVLVNDTPEYLKNVGIVITRDTNFNFEFTHPEDPQVNTTESAQKALLAAGNEGLLKNVSSYEYYFEKEQNKFNTSYTALKASIDRFTQTMKDFKAHISQVKVEKVKAEHQVANQSQQITKIMESMAINIKKIYDETIIDIRKMIGTEIRYVDKNLWSQIATEEDNVAKVKNLEYYKNSVLELNTLLHQTVRMSNLQSQSNGMLENLTYMGRYFVDQTGIWGPGYKFLSAEWQQKISINSIVQSLKSYFGDLERESCEGLRPLWKTYSEIVKRQGQAPSHKLDSEGFLEEE